MKNIRLIGGPADGQTIKVSDTSDFVILPVMPSVDLLIDENDVLHNIIGWDEYGPISKGGDLLQARYAINGDIGIYEERKE